MGVPVIRINAGASGDEALAQVIAHMVARGWFTVEGTATIVERINRHAETLRILPNHTSGDTV